MEAAVDSESLDSGVLAAADLGNQALRRTADILEGCLGFAWKIKDDRDFFINHAMVIRLFIGNEAFKQFSSLSLGKKN